MLTFAGEVTFDNVISAVRGSFVSTLTNATVLSAEGNYTSANSVKLFEAKRTGGAVAGNWSYDDATTDMSLGTSTSHSFSLKTGNTRALTIDSSQNATFAGDVNVQDNLYLQDGSTTRAKIQLNASDTDDLDIKAVSLGSKMKFFTVDTERMRIDSGGDLTVMSSYSGGTFPFRVGFGTYDSYTPTFVINDTGNVGIGISSGMTYPLTIQAASGNNSYAHFVNSTTGTAYNDGFQVGVADGSSDGYLLLRESANMRFYTGGSERMRITSDGSILQQGPQGGGDNTQYTWQYLKQNVGGGIVKHIFDLTNNGTSYANNLVLDRGNVAIGTTAPDVGGAGTSSTVLSVIETVGNRRGILELGDNQNADTGGIGSINFVGHYQDAGHEIMAEIRGSASGSTSGQRGSIIQMYTKENGTATIQERMRIDSSGFIYVNTAGAEPSASQVGVRITGTQGQSFWNSANSGTTGYNHFNFYNGNGAVGSIVTNGSATAFNTSSDYRLKENVVEMTGALDRVAQLKPSRFNFIADSDTIVDGFLAHEVQSVVPEAITGTKDAVDEEGNPDYQGIDQSKLVPLLVGAIQELRAEIELLKNK